MSRSVLRHNVQQICRKQQPIVSRVFSRYNSSLTTSPASSSSKPPLPASNAQAPPKLQSSFPNLMQTDVLLDSEFSRVYRDRTSGQTYKITIRNDPSYQNYEELKGKLGQAPQEVEMDSRALLPFKESALRGQYKMHKYPLITRRVTQQTGKGKKHRQYMLMVVGNGNGLVGYGEGKHEDFGITQEKAYVEAVRNMDFVDRFEKRTIWTNMEIKFGSTRILMRPRPVGFGLHCNPNVHQVLKAAGIKDISAKVWGSRNPINVIKATCMLIQAGNAPLSMGDGIGGRGRRLDAGSGMRSKDSVELERGRKLVDGRTW